MLAACCRNVGQASPLSQTRVAYVADVSLATTDFARFQPLSLGLAVLRRGSGVTINLKAISATAM
jgi:hypothetical protein